MTESSLDIAVIASVSQSSVVVHIPIASSPTDAVGQVPNAHVVRCLTYDVHSLKPIRSLISRNLTRLAILLLVVRHRRVRALAFMSFHFLRAKAFERVWSRRPAHDQKQKVHVLGQLQPRHHPLLTLQNQWFC